MGLGITEFIPLPHHITVVKTGVLVNKTLSTPSRLGNLSSCRGKETEDGKMLRFSVDLDFPSVRRRYIHVN